MPKGMWEFDVDGIMHFSICTYFWAAKESIPFLTLRYECQGKIWGIMEISYWDSLAGRFWLIFLCLLKLVKAFMLFI